MDRDLQDLKTNEIVQNDPSSVEKLKQSYLLLKQKMCGIHDVIKQYNDKLKECERLKVDLDTATKQIKKVTYNYNSTLAKVIKLELQNTEYKKNIETLTTQVNEHTLKAAADQQHIQQLICKIKDVESQQCEKMMYYDLEKSALQVKVKDLEQELKLAKKSCDAKAKKLEKKVPVEANKPQMKTVAINTVSIEEVVTRKVEVAEKCVMTSEMYNVKEDVYPIFCGKCEVLLEPPPVEKICQMMANSCPRIIEQISSPVKKVSVSVQASNDVSIENASTQTVNTEPETPPPRYFPNPNNHPDLMSRNFLSLHTPVSMNQPMHCNNFPRQSNLLNQANYFIEPTPMNPLSLSNSNTVNQNNQCGDLSTIASSLSIISSLQKRIDTLEVKLKKKLTKRKPVENSNCWEHKHPNVYGTYDVSSMQTNAIELCKKMMEFCENKDKKQVDVYEHDHKKSNKKKLSRLKFKKRLQNTCTDSWKIESLGKKVEHNPLRKRSKKRKYRRPIMQKKFDTPQNTDELEKSISDSDTNSYCDLFDEVIVDTGNVNVESNKVSNLEIPACPSRSSSVGEMEGVETIQNFIESNKSAGGETDSGILSDSIESSKVVHIETTVDAKLVSMDNENSKSVKTPVKTVITDTRKISPVEMPVLKTCNNSLETDINTEPLESEIGTETIDNKKPIVVPPKNIMTPVKTVISNTREISPAEMPVLKTCNNSLETDINSEPLESEIGTDTIDNKKPIVVPPKNIMTPVKTVISNTRKISPAEMPVLKTCNYSLETDINSEPLESEIGTDTIDNKKPIVVPPKNIMTPVKTSNNSLETDINSESFESEVSTETIDNKIPVEVSSPDNLTPQNKILLTNNVSSARKRKISELQKLSKCRNGRQLLRKIKTIKRNVANKCQTINGHQDVPGEHETPCASKERSNFDREADTVDGNEYVPKKRLRIAHVPKIVTEQNSSVNLFTQLTNSSINNGNMNGKSEINESENSRCDINVPIVEESIAEKYGISLNESPSVTQEIDSDVENTQAKSNTSVDEADVLNSSIDTENVTESHDISETIASDTDSFDSSMENRNPQNAEPNNSVPVNVTASLFDDSSDDIVESREMTESKDYHRNLDHNYANFLSSNETATRIDNNTYNSNHDMQLDNVQNEDSVKLPAPCNILSNNESQVIESSTPNRTDESTLNEICEPSQNTHRHLVHINYAHNSVSKSKMKACRKKVVTESISIKNETITAESKMDSPLTKLKQYVNEKKCSNRNSKKQLKKLSHIRLVTDKFIKKQLRRLMDSSWQVSLHCDVVEKFKSFCSTRIIAKGIVDFLCMDEKCNRGLDKTYTPPAPLMTKAQQRIAALVVDLEESHPTLFHFLQAGIEYKLFRLKQTVEKFAIESLARMYTILARIKKDRGKVRIFCCDALYCMGLNATIILYTVLTSWPEVFPNHETNKELLPKCMAHLITAQQATDYPKLQALKNLISLFYKYQLGTLSKELLDELLIGLQEKSSVCVETAIILLAKREGTAWTYKNIIRGALLPMIINEKIPSTYRAFCLLGSLMRVFPIEDKDNSVGEIVEQLCDLINSGEGSDEQQEGIISALLSLSRHKFDDTVQNVIKWNPNAPLRDRTIEQISGLFNLRTTDFWRGYLKKNKILL